MMFALETIPREVIGELEGRGIVIDPLTYGDEIDSNTVSQKLDYRIIEPLTEEVMVVDPVDFEPRMVDGSTHEWVSIFIARLNGNELRQLLSAGRLIQPKA